VWHVPESDRVSISVPVPGREGVRKRLDRSASESVSTALARLSKSLGLSAHLLGHDGETLDGSHSNDTAWPYASSLLLETHSNTQPFVLSPRLNPPVIKSLHSLQRPLVGMPLVAFASGAHDDPSSPGSIFFRWLLDDEEVQCGVNERIFIPLDSHVDKRVQVSAEPLDADGEVCGECVFQHLRSVVQRPPARRISTKRLHSMPDRSSLKSSLGEIRLASYNVLADAYRSAWSALFPYMREEHKEADYRLQLAFDDVRSLAPDVAGLQEVDATWFDKFWRPQASLSGYEAMFSNKSGGGAEGSALLIRRDTVEVIREERINLAQTVVDSPSPQVQSFLHDNVGIAEAAGQVTTVAHAACCRHISGASFVAISTHLYFHPEAGSLRILQMNELLRRAVEISHDFDSAPLIVMGDLNAEAGDGVIELLRNGEIGANFWEWTRSSFFRWSGSGGRDYSAQLVAESFENALEDSMQRHQALAGLDISGSARDGDVSANEGSKDGEKRRVRSSVLRRLRVSLNTACAGAECSLSELEKPEAISAEQAHAEAQRHAKQQCSLNTCSVLARYAARRDAGEGIGISPLSEDEVQMLDSMQSALSAACKCDMEAAREQQDALVESQAQRAQPEQEKREEAIGEEHVGCGMNIRLSRAFELASGADHPFTNFVGGFSASLDHILVERGRVGRKRGIDSMSESEVKALKEGALPNGDFPSDHIPLAVDVALEGPQ